MIESVAVELTWRDIHLAGTASVSRVITCLSRQQKPRFGLTHDGIIGADIEWMGMLGEMAVAKYTNRFWTSAGGDIGCPDTGDYEVRTVGGENYRLILHRDDHDDMPYVLAWVSRVRLPFVILKGFLFARDGKRQEWWQDPNTGRPAFFVPNENLLPMSALPVARGQAA